MKKTTLLRQLLFVPVLLLIGLKGKSQVLSESFDSPTFPPTGWINTHTIGTDPTAVWEPAAAAADGGDDVNFDPFFVDPHSGAGMAQFRSYDFSNGNGAFLASPAVNLSSVGPQLVTFWMYRDDGYPDADSVSVYINSSAQNLTGASFLGKVQRYLGNAPIESGAPGWYKYSFAIPVNFTGTTNYFIFHAVGRFGNNMFIDDITVEDNPVALCSGTPDAGAISGAASACANNPFTLTSTGVTDAPGIRYAWQSSANAGGPWSNIPGQNNFAEAVGLTQTTTTYYRLVDTCSISGLSDLSNVLTVTMNSPEQCYCQPPSVTLHSFVDDAITNVTITGTTLNSSNGTDALTGYTQVPPTPANNTADLQQITSYTVTATVAGDPTQVSVWVDFDRNGTFDTGEYFDLPVSGTTATGNITVPANAIAGLTGLRIRARFAAFINADACSTFASGETEDYVVNIVATTATNGALVDIITPSASCNASSNVIVKLKNTGNVTIPANAATVALYVTGANPQGPLTQTNSSSLLPGDTATLTFVCSFPVEGTNIDSAFIQSLAGDAIAADDTLLSGHVTLPAAVNAPYAEDFEGAVPGWTISQLSGNGNWVLASAVNYPDLTAASLSPKSGTTVALFDSYNYPSGTVARLATNCFIIPADANDNCGYVAGFYFNQDPQYYSSNDSLVVSISNDGGNSFTRLGVVNRVDTSLAPTPEQAAESFPEWKLYTFNIGNYAGQTVQFALDAYSSYGNQIGVDSFFAGPKTIAGNAALAGGQESGSLLTPALTECTDASGWTYYSDANSARYLFGVQWDPSGTGLNAAAKAQATAKITVDRKWFGAEDAGLKMATYTMQRYWDVNLNGATLTAPVNVRFFYSQREFDSIIAAKNNFIAANPGAIDEGFMWFKTASGEFIPSSASVNYDSVVDDVELQNANTTGATINGVLYAQFNGVTSFSGGTAASGVGPSTPLPVGLLSFNAQRTGRVNKVTWSTSQEINTRSFAIEHSTDGRNFTIIGQVAAAGNSANTLNYSFIDNTPVRGINFYRLKVIDNGGHEKYSAVRNVRNEGTADIAVYPNPVKDLMLVNITSDKLDKALISINDMNGKIVYTKIMNIAEGMNYVNVNTSVMSSGTYVIKIQLNNDLVVKKFSKF
jgi:hypothetical protein